MVGGTRRDGIVEGGTIQTTNVVSPVVIDLKRCLLRVSQAWCARGKAEIVARLVIGECPACMWVGLSVSQDLICLTLGILLLPRGLEVTPDTDSCGSIVVRTRPLYSCRPQYDRWGQLKEDHRRQW